MIGSRLIALSFLASVLTMTSPLSAGDISTYYHHTGPLAGTLKDDSPLPLFDDDPSHLWNRLFAAFYIRPRVIPAGDGQPEVTRFEGGDVIEFLAWGKTEYWSSAEVFDKVNPLLDEFLTNDGAMLISDPLKRSLFQHDVWAVYDHLIDHNIRRTADKPTRARRNILCEKFARILRRLALPKSELASLPDTYTLAVASGAFVPTHDFDAGRDYLPFGLLDKPDEWVEVDFHQPRVSSDISERFITLHARSLRGRSYYRIFYRFPEGRRQVLDYLKQLDEKGIDWKQAANNGFVRMGKDAPAIPVGTEVVLLQLMMSLDDELKPVPTRVVESFQFRAYANIDGAIEPPTNTGVGINVLDYRMKRHLLFDGLKRGGLEREPEGMPQYRVAIDGNSYKAPDWGFADKTVLFQQCVDCHMSRNLDHLGVASIPSIIHSGGFDAGAQMGVVHPVEASQSHIRGERVAKYKSRHETFRRMLEFLGE
ncbi:MAG: hypothetical protein WEB58_07205 [Planctomycetaceae bacterium]